MGFLKILLMCVGYAKMTDIAGSSADAAVHQTFFFVSAQKSTIFQALKKLIQ